MTTSITPMNVTPEYQGLTILTYDQLNDELVDIETYVNASVVLNLVQLALDVFGDTYNFNNDGIQTRTNPVITDYALLAGAMVVTGNWTFSGNTNFTGPVTSTSTFTSTGQQKCRPFLGAANQTIASAAITALSFDSESFDTGTMHDTSINPTRITIPAGASGNYIFNAQATFNIPSLTFVPAFLTGAVSATALVATWVPISDGSFAIAIDGIPYTITGIDFAAAATMADVASIIQTAIRTATGHLETVVWSTDHFIISSVNVTIASAITVTSATGVGTDISGVAVGFMSANTGNGVVTPAGGIVTSGRRGMAFYKNGSKIAETQCFDPDAAVATVLNLFVQDLATAGDYFEVGVYQNSGTALDVIKGERTTFASTIKVW